MSEKDLWIMILETKIAEIKAGHVMGFVAAFSYESGMASFSMSQHVNGALTEAVRKAYELCQSPLPSLEG